MPLGQAMLFRLKQNMPRTADKVLQHLSDKRSSREERSVKVKLA